jgi:hypothetical protein
VKGDTVGNYQNLRPPTILRAAAKNRNPAREVGEKRGTIGYRVATVPGGEDAFSKVCRTAGAFFPINFRKFAA